jgi:hypothetical protein
MRAVLMRTGSITHLTSSVRRFAIMLFGARVPGAVRERSPKRSVSDPECDREIRVLAQYFGFSYENF